MATATNAFHDLMAAEYAKLRRDSVDATLVDMDGTRRDAVITVERIPDGEHAGEPVRIDCAPATSVAAVEFDGRRFVWRRSSGLQGYWDEAGDGGGSKP